ncbi:MAG: MafI family immunity protein [Chloroflexota bacterium]
MDAAYRIDLERRLLQLLGTVAGQLQPYTVDLLERLIDRVGEYAVALEILCDMLIESGTPVGSETIASVEELVDMMGMDRTWLDDLRSYAANAQPEHEGS